MAAKRTNLQDRYELREILGRGGMGIVYKAYDRMMSREVALKTILDIDNPTTLNLFYKEWSTLVTMVHPNVINIYDIGEFEQEGATKPFFVMPLLPGVTLDKLIKEGSPRLTVAAVVNMMEQAARGLQASHEMGLVHRDVKPSNIFVMDDGWVKIIDFGIAREASANSKTTLKGTVYYLAPEQLELKPPSALSDLFALAVVTYEALTRRRPFQGSGESEVLEAIQKNTPPPISELNPEVPFAISQVVHKAMAKQPWHRFFNAKEFGEALTKAWRGEALEYFDSAKIKPRLERAAQSYEKGDYEFASDILAELEAEGHLDQGIGLLRGQVDQAVRQIRIKQTLENARRFFDAAEYPLALRKVQEALELDPTDATALSLKAKIEKDRREKKISEWITLARQHLENLAFRQAREALDNVLKIKPNDTDALRLAAEVGRREQEVSRLREEKAKLYQAAMQAWEKGDVTNALTKLEVLIAMDRDQPESDASRSTTYQGFYNKVQSEHNGLKNSYEEARRNLAADNCEAALAVCKQFLAKYPNHALFQALKVDVEERQRQRLSTVIAETDRRADEEPDLDRRLGVLEEALKLYPGEPHFMRAMELVRDKRDLVNSIVAKARFFEEKGQYIEALDQWQILRSIHEKQPGLAFEIERLVKRRDQQARQNSKARWVEQTDKYLEGGDYDRAMKTIQNALVEFPNEAELFELDKLVRKNQERAKQALDLLDRAREHSEKGAVEDSLESLRLARELDPKNSVIRTVLVNTLLEQARRQIDANPETADAAVQEILALDPNYVPARSLASQIADRKQEDFITWCLAQARRLQTDGDFGGAVAVTEQGLASYPNEARLRQLKATLERAQQEAERQPKPRPPATPSTENPTQTNPTLKPPAPEPLLNTQATLLATPTPLLATPAPPLETPKPAQPPAPVAAPSKPQPSKPEQQKAPQPKPTAKPPGGNKYLYAGVGGGAVLLLMVAAAMHFRKPAKPPVDAEAAKIKVTVRAMPAAAQISVNGNPCGASTCDLELAPGDYRAEATLPDYQPASTNFTLTGGQAAPEVALTLVPVPPLVTLSTDLTEGSVTLDRTPLTQIQGSDIEIPKLAAGEHTISVENGAFRTLFKLDVADGAAPKLSGPIQTQGMNGFLVVHSGNDGKVYASVSGATATLDGQSVGMVGADGLDLHDLSPASHQLVLESPAARATLVFSGGPSTNLVASLVTNQNLSVLDIVTHEDDVEVFLNNGKYRSTTRHGRLRIYLPPKTYAVRVHKEGFGAPPEQTVDLTKGQTRQLEFTLSAARATLSVHHGMAGAEVRMDGNRIGVVSSNGEFSAAYIEPGKHNVSLHHDRFKPIDSDQVFVAGKTIEIDGTMHSILGTLRIDLNPPVAEARIRIRRQGETQITEVRENPLSLPEGVYTIFVSAPHFQDATGNTHINGENTTVSLIALKAVEEKAPAKSVPTVPSNAPLFQLNDWLKVPGWTHDGGSLLHQGGDFVLAPGELSTGNIQFTVRLRHGKRIEWVVAFRDPKNYYLFQIDETNFNRIEVVDGKHSKAFKVAHDLKRDGPNTFAIDLHANGVGTGVLRDGKWMVLDNWQPAGAPASGQFGFHIPGRDQIELLDFRILPR